MPSIIERVFAGRAPARPRPLRDNLGRETHDEDTARVAVVSINDLRPRSHVNVDQVVQMDLRLSSAERLIQRDSLQIGDVLVIVRGVRYAASVLTEIPDDGVPLLASQQLAVIRPRDGDPELSWAICAWLSSRPLELHLLADSTLSRMPVMINLRQLANELPWPDDTTQLREIGSAAKHAADYERATRRAAELQHELVESFSLTYLPAPDTGAPSA